MIKFITNSVNELSLTLYAVTLVISALLLFTNWTLEVDPAKKLIRKNLRFLVLRVGRRQPYQSIEKIFINSVKESSLFRPNRIQTISISGSFYKAFMKLDDGEKILLDSDADKDALVKRLLEYNKELQTNILDNSDVHNPCWITA